MILQWFDLKLLGRAPVGPEIPDLCVTFADGSGAVLPDLPRVGRIWVPPTA